MALNRGCMALNHKAESSADAAGGCHEHLKLSHHTWPVYAMRALKSPFSARVPITLALALQACK
jgi:hypothetical protein